jgi:hypothetical protein
MIQKSRLLSRKPNCCVLSTKVVSGRFLKYSNIKRSQGSAEQVEWKNIYARDH